MQLHTKVMSSDGPDDITLEDLKREWRLPGERRHTFPILTRTLRAAKVVTLPQTQQFSGRRVDCCFPQSTDCSMKGSLLQRTRRCGLSMVLLFCLASPSCRALRRFAPADHKAALDLHKLAASKDMTAYGRQVAGTYVRNTSVDHFGSVSRPWKRRPCCNRCCCPLNS